MNPENAIEIRNMSKEFTIHSDGAKSIKDFLVLHRHDKKKKLRVLKDISLDIAKGETVALIGTNGSGKSTLLKLMTKIIYPTEGTVETKGKVTSLLELGAGFHQDFTGRENIYFNAAIFGLTEKEIEARMDEIISFSELGKFIDEPIRTYSSGMYMRLAFSIAINVDADIILIDEILAVGDQHFQTKCYNKLKELKSSDRTIVIVTHALDVVKDLCDRAIWIYKGEFRLDGDPVYVIDEYLKQVAIDHREEKRIAVEQGVETYKGIIFFDSPKDFARVSKNANVLARGWWLADCNDAKLQLMVNGKEVKDLSFHERADVMEAYQEAFGGIVDEKKVGWKKRIKVSDYVTENDQSLSIKGIVTRENGEKLTEKDIVIAIDEEAEN